MLYSCQLMSFANVLVVGLGLVSVVIAVLVSWKWRLLPLRSPSPVDVESNWRTRLHVAVRTIGAAWTAGVIAGVVVLGLIGRLVMRVLAATSGDSQGLQTEASETVGEITSSGTIGFIIFVGIGGGIFSALGYLVVRSWLPAKAGTSGLIFGILAVGTLGVSDALSPSNVDFAILTPRWLAVTLVVGTGILFATTFTAIAARLDQVAKTSGRVRVLLYPALVLSIVPPIGAATIAYIGIRTIAPVRLDAFARSAFVRVAGQILVAAATVASAFFATTAVLDILSA